MNTYSIWSILAVLIAGAAFIGTQLTARKNERAEFLLDRLNTVEKDLEKKTVELVDQTREVNRLTRENVILLRRLAGINGNDK